MPMCLSIELVDLAIRLFSNFNFKPYPARDASKAARAIEAKIGVTLSKDNIAQDFANVKSRVASDGHSW